ncbi:MAG: sigma-70 family RNA polymerase sigma factor [Pirellula sp.]|jgi:RNA polymerase sigma-70 factor (ECF subfamily)|nr:sigma-70 family RNA polymerase sigma factor [Pirellula sp.]
MLNLLNGNREDELAALFSRVRPHIRQLIENRLDRRLLARVDASDIVQETFVRANQSLATYLASPKMDPVTWLRLIGKHLVAEVHRHHFRAKRSPDRELNCDTDLSTDFLTEYLATSMLSLSSILDRQEMVIKIRCTLEQLTPADREIIEMRHIDELTLQESADILGITLEAAKKRYQRALSRIRSIVAPPE